MMRLVGVQLLPRQQLTLDIASSIVLSVLGLGVQVGGWPLWSVVLVVGAYCAWVIAYAESTVQAELRRSRLVSGQAPAPPVGEE